MQVKAVLFDLGGTIIKTAEIPHVFKKILDRQRIHRSLEEITQTWNKAEEELNHRDLPRLLDEFWVQWNTRVLSNLQIRANSHALAKHIATHWWSYSNVSLYPDAEKTLPMLQERGLIVGLITNGLQSEVNEILPKVGLKNFFDIIVMIDTLRKVKPDPAIFHYAIRKLRIRSSEAIFIGDEVETDYKGARNSGLAAYLIDRTGKIKDENVNTISSLHDLFEHKIIQ